MREIKFKYIYGIENKIETYFSKIFTLDDIEHGDHFSVLSDNPLYSEYRLLHRLLSTGRNDKNGKEIFEGDIVKYKYFWHVYSDDKPEIKVNEVTFSPDRGFFPIPFKGATESFDGTLEVSEVEIIGNIYENKELLK